MNALWQVPVVVAALLTWLSTPPESFAEAAEREALRRQLIGKAIHTYTNLDLPSTTFTAGPQSTDGPASAAEKVSLSTSGADEALSPAVEVRGEAWWRARVNTLRSAAERNEMSAKGVQAKVNAITADIVGRDDPFQRRELREQLQKALIELDRLESAALEARQGLETLQEEARRAGAPPGWLR